MKGFINVDSEALDFVWEDVAKLLQLAIDQGNNELTLDVVKERIAIQETLLYIYVDDDIIEYNNDELPNIKLAFTLDIMGFLSGLKTLDVTLIGGTISEEVFPDLEELIKRVAKILGIKQIRLITTRNGWIRKFKQLRPAYTILIGEVEDN